MRISSADEQALPTLTLWHIQNKDLFQRFKASLQQLLQFYGSVLMDDFCDPNPENLVSNTATYVPWLWLLTDEHERVYALASLSDIIPGRHAFVHGMSHPAIRKHPAIHALGHLILKEAFCTLGVHKVKAEVEGNNLGAKGFCRRMGFTREAHFQQDNCIGGQWQDVLVYSLFSEQFKANINNVL